LDSGTSFIYLPKDEYISTLNAMKKISSTRKRIICSGNPNICYMSGTCASSYGYLENIKFKLGNYIYSIPPEDYMMEFFNQGEYACVFGIMSSNSPYFLLGDSFLRSYLSIHDMATNRLGLVPHKYSKATIDGGSGSFPVWTIIVLALGGASIVIFSIILICRCRRNSLKHRIDDGSSLLYGNRV